MRIAIITPARPGTRTGNLHTATRWAAMLRASGHRVRVLQSWDGGRDDLLVALHARRSHDSAARWKAARPDAPLVVVLTGTDLYRDLPRSAEARRSLDLADRVIVLQEDAPRRLKKPWRRKTDVVYQSTDTALRHRPAGGFRVAVVGHLRAEKDPFRAVAAVHRLDEPDVEVVHIGAALDERHRKEALRWMKREPRYRWLGSVPHARALRWIASSDLVVVSSRMEGGANVVAEAARIGTPVLASRISGNVGMLGRSFPGYFRLEDSRALARLLARARNDPAFYALLVGELGKRKRLFAPAGERRALLGVVREAIRSRRSSR